MNETDIRKYAQLMKELNLTGLEITDDTTKVRLERTVSAAAAAPLYSVSEQAAACPPEEKRDDCISVTSPIVGMFYAAPAENAAPYVAVGDSVKKGQVLCVVEAMKLMNEITADCDGTIAEVCVANAQVVEYGTELFRIRR